MFNGDINLHLFLKNVIMSNYPFNIFCSTKLWGCGGSGLLLPIYDPTKLGELTPHLQRYLLLYHHSQIWKCELAHVTEDAKYRQTTSVICDSHRVTITDMTNVILLQYTFPSDLLIQLLYKPEGYIEVFGIMLYFISNSLPLSIQPISPSFHIPFTSTVT